MEYSEDKIKTMLISGIYNFSAIERKTEISRHWMKKIINGDKVPSYVFLALDNYFLNIGKKND